MSVPTKLSFPAYAGYNEYLVDDGVKAYVDKRTGEVIPCVQIDAPVGSRVLSPRQVKAQRSYRARGEQIAAARQTREYNGRLNFYFALSRDRRADPVRPGTLARVFFLATFLRSEDSRLYAQDGTPLAKSDLPNLLKLSKSSFRSFWDDAAGKFIFPQDDGSITIADEFFRGSLRKHATGENSDYQKLFISSLRELYWQTPPRRHRYLGFLFAILPLVHWEYNIVCKNPREADRTKVEPLSLDELCENVGPNGYAENQRQRLLSAFQNLKFEIDGTIQFLVAYLEDRVSGNSYLVVNPNVLYRGSDRSKVDGFGIFFPDLTGTKKLPKARS